MSVTVDVDAGSVLVSSPDEVLVLSPDVGVRVLAPGPMGPQGPKGDPGELTQAAADTRYVNVDGDSMSGRLAIAQSSWTPSALKAGQADIRAVGSATAFGYRAGETAGGANTVCVGSDAGYAPAGNTGNASTTATQQTIVGAQAGQGSSGIQNNITAIGYRATATASGTALGSQAVAAINALALGMAASATGGGSVAIGRDNAGTGASTTVANEIKLGTALHKVNIPGTLTLAGAAVLPGDADWIAPTLGNGWLAFGAPFPVARYRRLLSGLVVVQGSIKSGTVGAAVFNLPAGYRPSFDLRFMVSSNTGTAAIDVKPSGDVIVVLYTTGGSNVVVSLAGVSFPAEA